MSKIFGNGQIQSLISSSGMQIIKRLMVNYDAS